MAYNEKIADEICKEIAEGKQLKNILSKKGMPSRESIFYWRRKHPDFDVKYQTAWEIQSEKIFDDIVDIAFDESNDTLINSNGGQVGNRVAIDRANTKINVLKWRMERICPKKYLSENLKLKSEEDNNRPLTVIINGKEVND